MNSLFQLITFPVWFLQALYVRKVAIRLPEVSSKTLSNEREHEEQILVLGDSVAAGVGVNCINESLGGQVKHTISSLLDIDIPLTIHAKSGDTVADLKVKLDEIAIPNKAYCVISIGVNDVTRFTSRTRWRRDLISVFNKLFANNKYKNVKVVILAIPPIEQFPLIPFPLSQVLGTRVKRLNKETLKVVKAYPQASLLPLNVEDDPTLFAVDGFHPSAKTCSLLSHEVSSILLNDQINITP